MQRPTRSRCPYLSPARTEQPANSLSLAVAHGLLAQVNVKLVANLRKSIKHAANLKELGPGVNKKRVIQKVYIIAGTNLVDPSPD